MSTSAIVGSTACSSRASPTGVNIDALYSDHDHQLILVVDDVAKGRVVSEAWTREQV